MRFRSRESGCGVGANASSQNRERGMESGPQMRFQSMAFRKSNRHRRHPPFAAVKPTFARISCGLVSEFSEDLIRDGDTRVFWYFSIFRKKNGNLPVARNVHRSTAPIAAIITTTAFAKRLIPARESAIEHSRKRSPNAPVLSNSRRAGGTCNSRW